MQLALSNKGQRKNLKAKIFLLSFEALERTVALIIQMTCRPALNPSRPGKLALTLASVALCKYKEMQASLLFLVESRSCTLALDQPRAKVKARQGKARV
jgi:hypothetical protein